MPISKRHSELYASYLKALKKLLVGILPYYSTYIMSQKDEYFILAFLWRYVHTRIVPARYRVNETSTFKDHFDSIDDVHVRSKIIRLRECLSCGASILNRSSVRNEDRFASKSIDVFLDSRGRFFSDFLAENLGIRHYHIGYNKKTMDALAFVKVDGDSCHILAAGTHKDLYVETGQSVVEKVIKTEYPDEYERCFKKIPVVLSAENPTPKEAALLKTAGITAAFSDADGAARFVGLGVTSARTPLYVNRLVTVARDELRMIACDMARMLRAKHTTITSFEMIENVPHLVVRDHILETAMSFGRITLSPNHGLGAICIMLCDAYAVEGKTMPRVYPKLLKMTKQRKNA